MQRMGQHMGVGFAPGDELAVIPDETVAVGHGHINSPASGFLKGKFYPISAARDKLPAAFLLHCPELFVIFRNYGNANAIFPFPCPPAAAVGRSAAARSARIKSTPSLLKFSRSRTPGRFCVFFYSGDHHEFSPNCHQPVPTAPRLPGLEPATARQPLPELRCRRANSLTIAFGEHDHVERPVEKIPPVPWRFAS